MVVIDANAAAKSAASSVSWADITAVVIAGLAFLAATLIGYFNHGTAKQALKLAERQEARQHSQLELYLIDSSARRDSSTGDRVLEFHVRVSNPADRPNSILAAELRVAYNVEG